MAAEPVFAFISHRYAERCEALAVEMWSLHAFWPERDPIKNFSTERVTRNVVKLNKLIERGNRVRVMWDQWEWTSFHNRNHGEESDRANVYNKQSKVFHLNNIVVAYNGRLSFSNSRIAFHRRLGEIFCCFGIVMTVCGDSKGFCVKRMQRLNQLNFELSVTA